MKHFILIISVLSFYTCNAQNVLRDGLLYYSGQPTNLFAKDSLSIFASDTIKIYKTGYAPLENEKKTFSRTSIKFFEYDKNYIYRFEIVYNGKLDSIVYEQTSPSTDKNGFPLIAAIGGVKHITSGTLYIRGVWEMKKNILSLIMGDIKVNFIVKNSEECLFLIKM